MSKLLHKVGWYVLVASTFVMYYVINSAPQPSGNQFHINLDWLLIPLDLAILAGLFQLIIRLQKTGFALLVLYCACRIYTLDWILYSYSRPDWYAYSVAHITAPGILTLLALGAIAWQVFVANPYPSTNRKTK